MASYRGYRPFDRDRGAESPRIALVRRWLQQVDPEGHSLGTYVRRNVRGRRVRSVHAAGRAIDWAPSTPERGQWLADVLSAYPAGGEIQLVIWDRRQWGGRYGPSWGAYDGADPHTSHLHIETRTWS